MRYATHQAGSRGFGKACIEHWRAHRHSRNARTEHKNANRRVSDAGVELLNGIVATPVVPSRNTRVKRTFATRRVSAVPRRRKKKKTRELDVFDDGFRS